MLVMSVATYAGQSFNPQTKTRLEARQYRRVPEDTLNATLRDIHDFIQYAVVEAQRILFGEDLTKTFAVSSQFRFPIVPDTNHTDTARALLA